MASSLVGGGERKGEVFPLSGKCFSGLDHQDLLALASPCTGSCPQTETIVSCLKGELHDPIPGPSLVFPFLS